MSEVRVHYHPKNLLSQRLRDDPVLADEELAVIPLVSHVLELRVPHVLRLEHKDPEAQLC